MNPQRPVVVRWLMIGCTALVSLPAAWFIRLNQKKLPAPMTQKNPTPAGKNPPKHANATITIRNGMTQQAESTDRLATRRLFKARPTTTGTTRVMEPSAVAANANPAPGPQVIKKDPLRALTSAAPTPAPSAVVTGTPPSEALPTRTIIGIHASILLAPEFDDRFPDTSDVRISSR